MLGAKVSAGSSLENSDWGAQRMTDGIDSSFAGSLGYTSDPCQTSATAHEWIEIDLDANVTFNRMVIYPRTDAKTATVTATGWSADFTIQVKPDEHL